MLDWKPGEGVEELASTDGSASPAAAIGSVAPARCPGYGDEEALERLLSPVGPASEIIYFIRNDGDCLELAGSYLPSWAGPQRSSFGRNIDLETEMREEIPLFRYRWLWSQVDA